MSAFYSRYSDVVCQLYIRHPDATEFKTEPLRLNWEAAQRAVASFSDEEKLLLEYIYGNTFKTPTDALDLLEGAELKTVKKLIPAIRKQIAIERGLI